MGVALLALFVALGGVSYGLASGSIDSREIKNNSVRGKDLRDRTISTRDIAPRTRRSLSRPGAPGAAGPPGAPGTALAFARVTNNPFAPASRVDEANSRQIAESNVTFEASGGAICFYDLPFDPRSLVANLETGPADVQLNTRASADVGDALCPGNEAGSVALRDETGNLLGANSAPYTLYVVFN